MKKAMLKKIVAIFPEYQVSFAFLFVSEARGDTGPMSDIDIAFYFDSALDRQARFNKKLRIGAEIAKILGRDDIDIVPLNDAYSLLAHRILSQGKLIYCDDIKKEKEYEERAIGEYLDWEPNLREQVALTFA